MKALIQRVAKASVRVDDAVVGEIGAGLLLFLGIEKDDDEGVANQLIDKVLHYRVFSDEAKRMNLSLTDVNGALLVVSQFTLVAETRKGLRPSFSAAATPDQAERLYDYFVAQSSAILPKVETGRFAADMAVELVNDGPVTFLLNT